jgi:hypothetical protein
MGERTRIDDAAELINMAVRCLFNALRDGDAKHPPGTWMKQTAEEHKSHLYSHIDDYEAGDTSEDHLAHAICRVVMYSCAKREELIQRFIDYGKRTDA